MKRIIAMLLATTLVLAVMLCSCAAKSESFDRDLGFSNQGAAGAPGDYAPEKPGTGWDADYSEKDPAAGDSLTGSDKPTNMSEKMIYTANVTVETTDFEASVQAVQDMVKFYGAFFESTNISDLSYSDKYYGSTVYRSATYTIRVPVARFDEMTQSMGAVGNVVRSSSNATNITAQFYDVQARRDAYGVEQERLLAMLAKCETVYEMIEIESRLSEVRYQLESLESTLRNWQNEVDYSTVNLTLREVEELTKRDEPHRGYWQQIADGFMDTLEGVGSFFKNLFKNIVIALPVIVLVAVIAVLVIVPLTRSAKRRRAAQARAIDADIEEDK